MMNDKPKLYFANKSQDMADLNLLIEEKSLTVVDRIEQQIRELCLVRHPNKKGDEVFLNSFIDEYKKDGGLKGEIGVYVFYPWRNTLVHVLVESDFREVMVARNIPLITKAEQKKLSELSVGVVGLSVGHAIATTLAHTGGGKVIKLADPDNLELSNVNRVKTSIVNLGANKALLTARELYEIDPYSIVNLYEDGIHAGNLKEFLTNKPKVDLLIDEADDILLKLHLRLAARALRIPLLMVTDHGFDSTVSLVRFDLNPGAGGMGQTPMVGIDDVIEGLKISEKVDLTSKEELRLIANLLGPENISGKMKKASMDRVTGKIGWWPQLGMTAFIGGALGSFVVKELATKKRTIEGDVHFSMLSILDPEFGTKSKKLIEAENKNFVTFLEEM